MEQKSAKKSFQERLIEGECMQPACPTNFCIPIEEGCIGLYIEQMMLNCRRFINTLKSCHSTAQPSLLVLSWNSRHFLVC